MSVSTSAIPITPAAGAPTEALLALLDQLRPQLEAALHGLAVLGTLARAAGVDLAVLAELATGPVMLDSATFAARMPKATPETVERHCRDGAYPNAISHGKMGWLIPEYYVWSKQPPVALRRWFADGECTEVAAAQPAAATREERRTNMAVPVDSAPALRMPGGASAVSDGVRRAPGRGSSTPRTPSPSPSPRGRADVLNGARAGVLASTGFDVDSLPMPPSLPPRATPRARVGSAGR